MHGLDWPTFRRYLEDAAAEYATSAPTVANYIDDLYIRLDESPESVNVRELLTVCQLKDDGQWEQANYAANRIYHLQSQLGVDTTGQAGF